MEIELVIAVRCNGRQCCEHSLRNFRGRKWEVCLNLSRGILMLQRELNSLGCTHRMDIIWLSTWKDFNSSHECCLKISYTLKHLQFHSEWKNWVCFERSSLSSSLNNRKPRSRKLPSIFPGNTVQSSSIFIEAISYLASLKWSDNSRIMKAESISPAVGRNNFPRGVWHGSCVFTRRR